MRTNGTKRVAIALAAAALSVAAFLAPARGAAECSWSPSSVTFTAEEHFFDDVAAASSTLAWAVGAEYEYDVAHSEAVVQEWDGLEWTDVPVAAVPIDHALHGTTAIPGTPDEGWAVGGKRNQDDEKPIVMLRTSTGWELADIPNVPGRLLGVDARSSSDAWAVGYDEENHRSLVMHWDGSEWKRTPAPSPGVETYLSSVVVLGANNVWAVGRSEHAQDGGEGRLRKTLALRWNGTSWNVVTTPNVGAFSNFLEDIDRIPGTTKLWAVGYKQDTVPQPDEYKTLAMRWNGTAWKVFATPNVGKVSQLHAVTAISGTDVWAFGVNSPNNRLKPLLIQWDGSTWTKQPGPVDTSSGGWLVGSTSVPESPRIWTVGFHFPPGADGDAAYVLHGCEPS